MMDDDYYFDDCRRRERQRDGLTVERALYNVAPLVVTSLLKKHQSLLLAISLADAAFEVHRQYKAKRPMGELVLLRGDYS